MNKISKYYTYKKWEDDVSKDIEEKKYYNQTR